MWSLGMDKVTGTRKGCGNCRERKILCDRTTPECLQCSRSNRVCKGYGLLLSWPRPNDQRRAVVASHMHLKLPGLKKSDMDARLIHAYASDVALHYYLSASLPAGSPPRIPMPFGSTMPGAVTTDDHELLLYFGSHASRSLPLLGDDPYQVGSLLMRMALPGDTPSKAAMLYALLALSSLHRNGIQEQAIKYKIIALNRLALASRTRLDIPEVLQHLATGMLLGSFEVHQASPTSGDWLYYINAMKQLLNGICPDRYHTVRDEEQTVLLKWVHYHDVLARFALRHWTAIPRQPISTGSDVQSNGRRNLLLTLTDAADHFDRPTGIATLGVLEILREVCDAVTVVPRLASIKVDERDDYVAYLQVLDWRLRNLAIDDQSQSAELRDMVKLYRLAVLIYLHRMTEDVLGLTAMTGRYLDEAFELFARLEACERLFPLFILGIEARTEEERAVVLELMSRTERRGSSSLLMHVRMLVNAVWTQGDLSSRALNYREKITAVMSTYPILPSLV